MNAMSGMGERTEWDVWMYRVEWVDVVSGMSGCSDDWEARSSEGKWGVNRLW